MKLSKRSSLRTQIVAFSIGRTILNTGFRMVYPFLPTISRGLNVDMSVVALAVSVRSWLGLASPLIGSSADLRGRKRSMLLGMAVFTVGFVVITLWPTVGGLFIAMILSAGGKILLDPAVQAFLGDHVDYSKRGAAIAITELGWSASYLVGIPLVGILIAKWDWRAPFLWLSCLAFLAAILLNHVIPQDATSKRSPITLRGTLRNVISHPSARAGVLIGMLITAGNESVTIIYGAWMEQAFQTDVAALGVASALIGLAELSGEGSVAIFIDRIGKRSSMGIGLAINTAACLALPFLGQTLMGALVGLFLFYLSFEFTLVSSIPVMTEFVPNARATTMSALVAGFAAGRGIGALLGPAIFGYGVLANCILAAAFDITALIILYLFVRE